MFLFCTQALYLRAHCSTVEVCVCVCVSTKQVFFFVLLVCVSACLSDGAMMVTHR